MNRINYKESIDLKENIKELLLINIDDNISQTSDNDFLNITGEIKISGEVNTLNSPKNFSHTISVDISLSKEQLASEEVTISVDDFTYNINENFIDIDLYLKINGLKEIETSFSPQEDTETVQVREIEETTECDETLNEEEENLDIFEIESTNPYKYSLLEQVFKHRSIKKEKVYLIHVVKNETSYEEIASLYGIDETILKEMNNNKEIVNGKLIFIPTCKWKKY